MSQTATKPATFNATQLRIEIPENPRVLHSEGVTREGRAWERNSMEAFLHTGMRYPLPFALTLGASVNGVPPSPPADCAGVYDVDPRVLIVQGDRGEPDLERRYALLSQGFHRVQAPPPAPNAKAA